MRIQGIRMLPGLVLIGLVGAPLAASGTDFTGLPEAAARQISDLCLHAAADAARGLGVPFEVLHALALTETGRRIAGAHRPWPWAINIAGQGAWFATRAEALEAAQNALAEGVGNVDLGCFQINHRWHADRFASLDAMLDPVANAHYAARYLQSFHHPGDDWSVAAGAYHSRSPAHAERYRTVFAANLARGPADVPDSRPAVAQGVLSLRVNRYPLLRDGPAGAAGSLVPATERTAPGLLVQGRRLFGDG